MNAVIIKNKNYNISKFTNKEVNISIHLQIILSVENVL